MTDLIRRSDLPPDLSAAPAIDMMVDGANGQAARVAPALAGTPTDAQRAEARLVLLGAITRWVEQGTSGIVQQTAGPFGVTVASSKAGYRLWPSEVQQLIEICNGTVERRVFAIDTAPRPSGRDHDPSCDFFFQRDVGYSCSCGAG